MNQEIEVKTTSPLDNKWFVVLRRYLVFSTLAHLSWETAQLPLYTLWTKGELYVMAFAIATCTGADILIAFTTLGLALVIIGHRQWFKQGFGRIELLTISLGVSYTLFSEWLNIVVLKSWAYSELMPIIPVINTGLSPIAQWLIIPAAGLMWARHPIRITT